MKKKPRKTWYIQTTAFFMKYCNRSTARISSKCNRAKLHTITQNEEVYFSIALDESTNKTDSAQVLCFIRATTKDFQYYKELLALGTLTGRTSRFDIFENLREICHQLQLNVSNLANVCTDGALSMRGKKEGFVALLKQEDLNLKKLISFHCILHQQNPPFCKRLRIELL